MNSFLNSPEWIALYEKYRGIFERDGGANESGVGVVGGEEGKREARLIIDLEVSF